MNIKKLRSEYENPHHLITSSDGKILFLKEWEATETSETAVLILHGITAYSEPYSMIGSPLSKNGFTTYGLDLRGHGLSDGNRGDYPGEDQLLDDLFITLDFIRSRHKKLVVLGHSLGVVTVSVIMNHMLEKIDGAVLLSASRTVRAGAYKKRSILTTLNILISSIFKPSHQVIHYYRDGIQGLDDPLFNFYYTLRFLKVLNPKKLDFPEKIDFPVYVSVGDEDELFAEDTVKDLMNEINSEDKEFHLMKNAKHAEFPEGSFDHMISWLTSKF